MATHWFLARIHELAEAEYGKTLQIYFYINKKGNLQMVQVRYSC